MNPAEQLKQDLKKATPIIGVEVNLKKLRKGELKKIYLAHNCKEKETIKTYAQELGTELIELEQNNVEVGVLCKKPFSISVLGFE